VARAAIEPVSVFELDGSESAPDVLAADAVLPVCGLGNPRTFVRLVERLAASLCEPVVFADHHRYDRGDVRGLLARARRQNAARVVTTRKDWVKLAPLWPRGGRGVGTMPLSRLDVRCALIDPDGAVDRALERIFVVNT
jgi:tetraacyldisaccharide 4'-kinase